MNQAFDGEFYTPSAATLMALAPRFMAEPMTGGTPPADSKRLESVVFTYDANGNQLTEIKKTYNPDTQAELTSVTTTHVWDAQNRLKQTTSAQGTNSFKYNAEGKRVEKINAASAPTRYLYEGKTVLLELDVNGNQTAKNIHGLKILKRNVTGKELSYFYNAHGDIAALLDKNGVLSGRYDYDAFGNLTEETDGHGNPYKYAGYEHDSETGLYNLKARYYSPKTARFVSEDTYRGQKEDPLSLNLYTYCHNEPVRYVDPTGFAPQAEMMVEGATVSAGELKQLANKTTDKKEKARLNEIAIKYEAEDMKRYKVTGSGQNTSYSVKANEAPLQDKKDTNKISEMVNTFFVYVANNIKKYDTKADIVDSTVNMSAKSAAAYFEKMAIEAKLSKPDGTKGQRITLNREKIGFLKKFTEVVGKGLGRLATVLDLLDAGKEIYGDVTNDELSADQKRDLAIVTSGKTGLSMAGSWFIGIITTAIIGAIVTTVSVPVAVMAIAVMVVVGASIAIGIGVNAFLDMGADFIRKKIINGR